MSCGKAVIEMSTRYYIVGKDACFDSVFGLSLLTNLTFSLYMGQKVIPKTQDKVINTLSARRCRVI